MKNYTNVKTTAGITIPADDYKHLREVKSVANLVSGMYDTSDVVRVLAQIDGATVHKGYGAITGIYLDNGLVKLRISARIAGQYTSKELASIAIVPQLYLQDGLYVLDSLLISDEVADVVEIDPFDDYLNKGRSSYTLGNMTDDALANDVFLHGNEPLYIEGIIAGTHFSSLTYLTAAKERIRWLSRQLLDMKFKEAIAKADPFVE